MTRGATGLGWIAVASVLAAAAVARAEEVIRLRYDLAAATLDVSTAEGQLHFSLTEGLGERVARFRADLAEGTWSREEAAALGRDLLGPATDALEASILWEVTPPEVAPLAAVVAPWEAERPLVHRIALWYRPAGVDPLHRRANEATPVATGKEEGVLAVMPFQPGVDPHVDSGDTLLAAFRLGSRTVDLLPRNDTTVASIAGTLEEHRYSMVWVRASRTGIEPLLAPLSTGPYLLWWSRPWREHDDATVDDAFPVAARWTAGGKSLLVDLWPRSEATTARGARAWMDAIAEGFDLATALARARRDLADTPGAPVSSWAGWILVGDGQRALSWREPNWLQRLLRRGNQNSR